MDRDRDWPGPTGVNRSRVATLTATLMVQVQTMNQELEEAEKAEKEIMAKMPKKLKSASGWKIFQEALETYLAQLKGQGNTPIRYIIHNIEVPILMQMSKNNESH